MPCSGRSFSLRSGEIHRDALRFASPNPGCPEQQHHPARATLVPSQLSDEQTVQLPEQLPHAGEKKVSSHWEGLRPVRVLVDHEAGR